MPMKTKLIYYQKPYQKQLKTTVTAINQSLNNNWSIQLAETIFYPLLQPTLESLVNQKISENLPIKTAESTAQKLAKICRFIPPNLPANKPLRYLQIGDFTPMPDGGVQVKSTKEIGKVRITSIQSQINQTKIKYQVIQV